MDVHPSLLVALDTESALALLPGTGQVTRGALLTLAAEGYAFSFGGNLVLAGVQSNALMQTRDLYLAFVAPPILASCDALERLVATASSHFGGADRVLLRTAPEAAPRSPWFSLAIQYFSSPMDREPVGSSPAWTTRPASPAELPFVHTLLAEAFVAGCRCAGRTLDHERALAHARQRFPPAAFQRAFDSLVALDGDTLIGHLTWRDGFIDELTESGFVELVDVFVLSAYRAQAVTKALVASFARRTRAQRQPVLSNVVSSPDGAHLALHQHLQQSGWRPAYALWTWDPSPSDIRLTAVTHEAYSLPTRHSRRSKGKRPCA